MIRCEGRRITPWVEADNITWVAHDTLNDLTDPMHTDHLRHRPLRPKVDIRSKDGTHLIIVGKIHRVSPSWAGWARRLPLGRSMYMHSQTSPRTFAKDVRISANTTSEK